MRKMIPWAMAAALAAAMSGCSDQTPSETQKLLAEVRELSQQVRQYRSEAQRANEKLVAMLNQHGLQSEAAAHLAQPLPPPPPTSAAAPAKLDMDASKALLEANCLMSQRMGDEPLTGNPDRDFLAQMIPHHQGAVDMSRILLQSGNRPELKQFAQAIIAHQQAEIVMMRAWLEAMKK